MGCLTVIYVEILLVYVRTWIVVSWAFGTMCFVDRKIFCICLVNFSIYVRTPHSAFFRYIVWCHTVRAFFFPGVSWWVISVCFGDGRRMLWLMCNMKLLIICGVCSCRLFRKGVGSLSIISSKFCDVPPVNVLDMVP